MRLTLLILGFIVVGCGPRRFELDSGRTQVVVEEPLIRVSLDPGVEVNPIRPLPAEGDSMGKAFNRPPAARPYPWVLDFEAALTAPERGRLARRERVVRAARINGLGVLELDLGHRVLEVHLGQRRVVGTTIVGVHAPVAPAPHEPTVSVEGTPRVRDVVAEEPIFPSTSKPDLQRVTFHPDGGGWR
ncbi:MAG: hypothetical protein Q8S33_38495 [Myxococcales bacterium]|nr:hypothetical protein [Myxococcales bacterium]MDP3506293.1 hypothetical protein [Myxococcales bacterium]